MTHRQRHTLGLGRGLIRFIKHRVFSLKSYIISDRLKYIKRNGMIRGNPNKVKKKTARTRKIIRGSEIHTIAPMVTVRVNIPVTTRLGDGGLIISIFGGACGYYS